VPTQSTNRLLRLPEVLERTGLSESAVRRMVRDEQFPRQLAIGPRTAAWSETEVQGWIDDRVAARDGESVT